MRKIIYFIFVLSVLLVSACKVQDIGQQKKPVELVIDSQPGGVGSQQQPQAGTGPVENATAAAQETEQENNTNSTQSPAQETGQDVELREDRCNEAASLGYISCAYNDKDLVINVKNAGRGDIGGVVYRFYDPDHIRVGQEQDLFSLKIGEQKELSVPLSKYGEAKNVDIHPVQGGKICSNMQLVVIPTTNCI